MNDYRSKRVLLGILENWLTFSSTHLESLTDRTFRHYFDLDIIQCDAKEVFIDIGAYVGDTVIDFLASYKNYKKIHCYEIEPNVFKNSRTIYLNILILNFIIKAFVIRWDLCICHQHRMKDCIN